jgi:hypothetical protein
MRNKSVMLGAAALLLTGGIASAQLPPGHDSQQDRPAATGSGYGAPYSPRNAPNTGETTDATTGQGTGQMTGRATRLEEQWPVGSPNRPLSTMPDFPSTTGQAFDKRLNPEESKSGMDQ